MKPSILLSMIVALAAFSSGQETQSSLDKELQSVLQDFLHENPSAPGISVAVNSPDLDLTWSGAVGTIAHDSNEAMTGLHTFRIASNTKTYTAAAILRLVEMGELRMDASLASLLPKDLQEFLHSDGYDLDIMTLEQVLSHTSGLSEHAGDQRYPDTILKEPSHEWTVEELVGLCVEWFDPVGQPGEKFSYSDTGYILLGKIIELKTGKNLGRAVRELLNFEKLGLQNTWWEVMEETPISAGPRAHQYLGERDTTFFHPSFDLYGGGGIVSNTTELGAFMEKLLKGEVFAQEKTTKAMIQGGTKPYRLGLMSVELDGCPALGHQGFWNTFAFHIPSLNLTVSGCILNHHAQNGRILAGKLVSTVNKHELVHAGH